MPMGRESLARLFSVQAATAFRSARSQVIRGGNHGIAARAQASPSQVFALMAGLPDDRQTPEYLAFKIELASCAGGFCAPTPTTRGGAIYHVSQENSNHAPAAA